MLVGIISWFSLFLEFLYLLESSSSSDLCTLILIFSCLLTVLSKYLPEALFFTLFLSLTTCMWYINTDIRTIFRKTNSQVYKSKSSIVFFTFLCHLQCQRLRSIAYNFYLFKSIRIPFIAAIGTPNILYINWPLRGIPLKLNPKLPVFNKTHKTAYNQGDPKTHGSLIRKFNEITFNKPPKPAISWRIRAAPPIIYNDIKRHIYVYVRNANQLGLITGRPHPPG